MTAPREWTTNVHYNMDGFWQHYIKWKKPERSHIVWFHLHKVSRIGKSIETESRLLVARGRRKECFNHIFYFLHFMMLWLPGVFVDPERDRPSQSQLISRESKQPAWGHSFDMQINQSTVQFPTQLILSVWNTVPTLNHSRSYGQLETTFTAQAAQSVYLPNLKFAHLRLTLPCRAFPTKITLKAPTHASVSLLPPDHPWHFSVWLCLLFPWICEYKNFILKLSWWPSG